MRLSDAGGPVARGSNCTGSPGRFVLRMLAITLLTLTGCATNAAPPATVSEDGTPSERATASPEVRLLEEASPEPSGIEVVLLEWNILPDSHVAGAGAVTFLVRNDGLIPHELAVFRTGLEPSEIPVVQGQADPSEAVASGSTGEIAPGSSQPWALLLPQGEYVLLCNLPAHYEAGMRTRFTVE